MPFTKNETLLVFRIAGIPFAISAETVGSILMPPSHITHAPGSGRSTPGIFHHADFTYAVIDLHERFGIDIPRSGQGRLLLHEDGAGHFAFIVDEVVGLIRSEQGNWANLPHYLPRELFSIGFLYQEEIVLCSELSLLRNMHDVEPLRRHLEQLQQKREQSATDKTESPSSGTEHPHSTTETVATAADNDLNTAITKPTAATAVSQEKNAARPTTTTALDSKKVTPHPSFSPPKSAVVNKPHTAVAHNASPVDTSREPPIAHKPAAPKPVPPRHQPPASSTPPPPPGRTSSIRSPDPVATQSDTALIWLVLFLLVIVALPITYLFWPQPSHHRQPRSVVRVAPPVTAGEEPLTTSTEAPLRIERDDDGTINLIIDRKAAASDAPTKAESQDKPATVAEETTVAVEEQSVETKPSTDSEPKPCDCTHIVVWGDTLWDIAERYTGNAFNYPQLAKRSGIKNPNRIYPGDRVRIIIR